MLELCAASGFSPVRLERIGLSRFHGVGAACFRAESAVNLATLPREGAAAREIGMLLDVGLLWAAPILDEGEPLGLLFFGGSEQEGEIQRWQRQILRAVLGSAAVALRNLRQLERLEGLSGGVIRGLVEAYEISNPDDRGHADRVAGFARLLGSLLGLEGETLQSLTIAALLHDIGKIGTLSNGSESTAEHRARIHPIRGSQILSRSKPVPEVIQAVEQHHERYDGHGQPYGLRGQGIHLFGRILAVANGYDRALRELGGSASAKDALRRLQRGAGLLYDPGLVAVFSAELERNPSAVSENRSADWFLEGSVSI
jgi:putative nucleotidyltransferase with HDIG domain